MDLLTVLQARNLFNAVSGGEDDGVAG